MGHGNVNAAFPENLRDPVDAQPTAMRLQDLFFVLSQGVDLGLLSITTAFGAARDLKKILGSGFEMIRISQCESPRDFRIYDKEMTKWRSNSGSQYRSTSVSSRSFSCRDLRQVPGSRAFSGLRHQRIQRGAGSPLRLIFDASLGSHFFLRSSRPVGRRDPNTLRIKELEDARSQKQLFRLLVNERRIKQSYFAAGL